MKKLFFTGIISLICLLCCSKSFAQSTVYFIYDHQMGWSELPFKVNGNPAFSLYPALRSVSPSNPDMKFYGKVVRKVVFQKADRYIVSMDNTWYGKPYHAETILNLDDGETYYVELDFKITGITFKEIPASKGSKYIQKAQKNKKITVNPDFIYDK